MSKPAVNSYDLFISYKHEPDYRLARHLESLLEDFHRLKVVSDDPLPRLNVCVDGSDFSLLRTGGAQEDLESLLQSYLERSARLLVLCSKNAMQSPFIDFELRWFLAHKGADKILIAVTEPHVRDLHEVLPVALLEAGMTNRPWYDFRGFRHVSGKPPVQVQDFDEAKTGLAADLLGRPREEIQPAWFRKRQAAARRRLRIVSATAVGTTLLAVAAVYFGVQSDKMRRQSDQRLQDALTLAQRVHTGINRDLRDNPSSTALRERLLSETSDLLAKLGNGDLRDDRVLAQQAAAFYSRGQLAFSHRNMPLAAREYGEALRLFRRLGGPRAQLAASYTALGLVDEFEGRFDEAEAKYKLALDIYRRAEMDSPGSLHDEIAHGLTLLGNLYLARGNPEAAVSTLEQAIAEHQPHPRTSNNSADTVLTGGSNAAYQALLLAEPRNAAQFAETLSSLANAFRESRRTAESRSLFEQVEGILRTALRTHPDHPELQQTLAIALSNHAALLQSIGESSAAWDALKEEHAIWKALVRKDPGRLHVLHGLAVSHERMGDFLRAYGDSDSARKHYQGQVESAGKLVGLDPSRAYAHQTLAHGFQRLRMLEEGTNPDSAAAYAAQAVDQLRLALAADRNNTSLSEELAGELATLAETLFAARRWEESSIAAKQAETIYLEAVAKEPGNSKHAGELQQIGDLKARIESAR